MAIMIYLYTQVDELKTEVIMWTKVRNHLSINNPGLKPGVIEHKENQGLSPGLLNTKRIRALALSFMLKRLK